MRRVNPTTAFAVLIFLCLLSALPASGDRLYKAKILVATGYGSLQGGSISWMDCSKKPAGSFKKPPHWFTKGDDCKLNAAFFGLELKDGRYVAADLEKLRGVFPQAKNGDSFSFEDDGNDIVKISDNKRTVSFPPDLKSALAFLQAITASPENPFSSPTPQIQTELLNANSVQALEVLKAAQTFKTRLPKQALANAALLGFALEDYKSVDNLVNEGLQSSPPNGQLLLVRGLVGNARGQYSSALHDYSDATAGLESDPTFSAALLANKALAIRQTGQTESAEKSLRASVDLLRDVGATDQAAYINSSVADVLRDRGRLAEAEGVLRLTSTWTQNLGSTEEARLSRQTAQLAFLRGNTAQAESLVEKAIEIHGQVDSAADLGEDWELLAEIKAELKSFPEALEPLKNAWKAFSDARYLKGQAKNRLKTGEVLMGRGDYDQARGAIQQAADLFSRLDDVQGGGEVEIAKGTLILRGMSEKGLPIDQIQKSVEEALNHFKNALDIFHNTGYKIGVADAHKGICVTLMLTVPEQELLEAASHCEKAASLYREMDFPRGVGDAEGNLGIIARLRKDWGTSIKMLDSALRIHKDIGFKLGMGRQLFNLGRTYLEMDNPKQAAEYFHSARQLFEETGASYERSMAERFLQQASN